MLAGLCQRVIVNRIDIIEQGVIEIVDDRYVDGGKTKLFGIHNLNPPCIFFEESEASFIQRSCRALRNLDHERAVCVCDFERSVEVLSGVDAC